MSLTPGKETRFQVKSRLKRSDLTAESRNESGSSFVKSVKVTGVYRSWRPPGAGLYVHLSDPRKLSQWLCYSTVNIAPVFTILFSAGYTNSFKA